MMKRIMTPRAAAVAFAASALFAAPAVADQGRYSNDYSKRGATTAVHFGLGNGVSLTLANGNLALRNHHSSFSNRGFGYNTNYSYNRRGQNSRRLRQNAVRACARAVNYKGEYLGFRDVDLEDVERIQQIGRNSFRIRAEFEFENRRRDFDRDVFCTVRNGQVVDIDGLPSNFNSRGYNSGYGYDRNYNNAYRAGY